MTANPVSNANTPAGSANSAENPFPVRAVAIRIASWIDKLGAVWVEGQLTQINIRPGAKTVFMVLRDPGRRHVADRDRTANLVDNAPVKLVEGVQVVVCGKPNFFTGRGTLTLRLSEIRQWASVNCWPASSDCASCWPPKASSIHDSSGQSLSYPA